MQCPLIAENSIFVKMKLFKLAHFNSQKVGIHFDINNEKILVTCILVEKSGKVLEFCPSR